MKIELTPEQKKIVEFLGAPMRVLAGPGTGKTLCIIEKAKFLIEQRIASHDQICLITFTKATARELWERLEKTGIKSDKLPYVNTLHGLAMGILRKHLKRAGLEQDFRLVDGISQRILIKDVVQDLKERKIYISNYDVKVYIKAHFQDKSKAGLPKLFSDNPIRQKTLKEFSKCFHENLRFYNAVDWSDVLHKAIDLLECYQDIRDVIHKKCQHLLVDEFQDLSPLEQFFVDKIVGNENGLCVVGDDDQSIYETFRFADPKGIQDFVKKYKSAVSFFITLCRRCPPEVINCASLLIKNNRKRVKKDLYPFNKNKKGFVVCLCHKSKVKEIDWLVSKVKELVEKGIEYRDILILFTDGDTAKDYVAALKAENIPLEVQLKVSNIFNSIYFIWVLATLRWLTNQADNLSLRQCLDYWKGIGPETVRQLKLLSLSVNSCLWEAIKKVASETKAFKEIKQRGRVRTFYTFADGLLKIKKFEDITGNLFQIIPEAKEDVACRLLEEAFRKFKGQEEVVTLKEILNDFEQRMETGELERQKEHKEVRVMSMHSAKGCEAPVVIIPALEEDIIPGTAENIEEQRRLFYVSLTRAKYLAFLSWATQRTGQEIHKKEGRKIIGKQKSRFVGEIGK